MVTTEKVYDAHTHYSFGMTIDKTIEILKKEFKDTNTEKCVFLSVPTHAKDKTMLFDSTQNIKGLFLKKIFSPNAYCYAGLEHPINTPLKERAEIYLQQAKLYNKVGYDGIKILEGAPSIRKMLGFSLCDNCFDKFYDYLEENKIPVTMHLANPQEMWDNNEYDNTYLTRLKLTEEMFGILQKHPNLRLALAHFGFMSYDVDLAKKFLSYKNTIIDLTPGGEQLINISKNWNVWHPFFIEYQDRIYYGTDMYAFPDNDKEMWKVAYHRRPDFVKNILGTANKCIYQTNVNTEFVGVNLEKDILAKIYRENIIKFLGEPKQIDTSFIKETAKKLLEKVDERETFPEKDDGYIIKPLEREERYNKYIYNLKYIIQNI